MYRGPGLFTRPLMTETDWEQIASDITVATGQVFTVVASRQIGGGCINQAWQLEGKSGSYFVKLNNAAQLDMFAAELEALQAIVATGTVTVPRPVCCGIASAQSYLVLEYLDIGRHRDTDTASIKFADQLAAMHRCTADFFGWHRENTIGTTRQINLAMQDWAGFWSQQRLGFQLELAARNGYHGRLQDRGQRLLAIIDQLLDGHRPQPSLLHGDLWSGNYAVTSRGLPVTFDPAPYYGDRETDLAMTELFGGFSNSFYQAYHSAWPLESGYSQRRIIYNLYHVLNHLNLFGGSYLGQAQGMIDQLLAELF